MCNSSRSSVSSVAVVVLARNAERTIAPTLRALAQQDVLATESGEGVSVHVIVNGTTDDTEHVAVDTWNDARRDGLTVAPLHVQVLGQPGKANAWNVAVHHVSGTPPDVYVFCDADVSLDRPDTLRLLVDSLTDHPRAFVATPEPRKSLTGVRSRVVRWLARRGLGGEYATDAIAGGCYAIRGEFARSMELPRTVTVEDGFLHAMVLTDQFTAAPDPARVVRVRGASFIFDAESSLRSLVDHERRLVIGGAYNAYAFRSLHETCGPSKPAGPVLIARNHTDPSWIDDLVLADKRRGRKWFVPSSYLTRRFHPERPRRGLLSPLVTVMGFVSDVVVSAWANQYFRTFESSPVWN